ncbi:hypothetical protein [Nocardia sp. NPDC020380]|uniref:hypothetical protein n=1 Tax=Nocardia sp. NPDC020380 TaxID=3364309 RepID=UPI0037987A8D
MKAIESVAIRAIGVVLLAVGATACSDSGGHQDHAVSSVVTSQPVSPVGELPLCGDVDHVDEHQVLADCRLQSIDGSGLAFSVHYIPSFGRYPWVDAGVRIEVSGPDGRVRQTLMQTGNFEMVEPRLADLAGDGRQELIVTLNLTITGNSDDQVYVSTAATSGKFALAGKADGTRLEREVDGLLIDLVHISAGSHAYSVYRLTDTKLENLIEIEDDPDAHGHHCDYVVPPTLAGTGLTLDQARTRYCALLTGR